ncbi:MmyB family transcriptional regulator [Nocardia jiangsuensis]|uniref:MmyB-like transcription regulator ligand binding domain-containing protein n=1 Tax=Nocardia jiangsuensis TaxID=1691563 RepID=A0ABV8E249_9NOCA
MRGAGNPRAAPGVVAAFRADAAHAADDPGFRAVITELGTRSAEFAELWARHDVAAPVQAVKEVHHPELGALTFDATALAVVDRPGQFLELYDPRPGTPTAQRMELLAGR